jgi:transposase
VNVLSNVKRSAVVVLLSKGTSHRQIAKLTGVHRKTIRSIAAGESDADGDDPAVAPDFVVEIKSECEPHRAFIASQLELGRNAMGIYQDLVDFHGFKHAYNSVKRFVAKLKDKEPDRFDVLDHYLPGEECQVDYGLGAPTKHPTSGKYRKPYLFVMVSKHSGKAYRRVVWNTNQKVWAQLHEEAWISFGGSFKYVVLDNLKEGVIKPDLYQPKLNPVYAAMVAHYGVVPDPAKPVTPDRKGSVENGVKHAQNTALKGKKFESLEEQNKYLEHWEERWASTRIHGRKKQQVMAMHIAEKPHLQALPIDRFRYFKEEIRTVDDSGFVHVANANYSALPSRIYSKVKVRIYDRSFDILKADGTVLRSHELSTKRGSFHYSPQDMIFNPTKRTADLLIRAQKIGPRTGEMAERLFKEGGRTSHRLLYGIANLASGHAATDIEAIVASGVTSFDLIRRALAAKRDGSEPKPDKPLSTAGDEIRDIDEYQNFFDEHANDTGDKV